MAYGVVNADKMTTSDGVSSSGLYGFKNRIINGAMVIDQRNAGAVMNMTGANYGTCDRWKFYYSAASKFTAQQNAGSITPPAGFTNYLGITSLSAYTVGAGEEFDVCQFIEGYNVADLGFGSANAKTVTLSFWVRSSLTGTFGGALQNSGSSRSYVFSYTISSANTWEQKSITITGDTSGTWLTTNGLGINCTFGIGQGSSLTNTAGSWYTGNYNNVTGGTSVVGTNGATFYITGVQLEKGSTATSFDYRPYGTELALCQRYYWRTSGGGGSLAPTHMVGAFAYSGSSVGQAYCAHPVTMRANPTSTISSLSVWNGSSTAVTSIAATNSSTIAGTLNLSTGSGSLSGYYNIISPSSGTGYVDFSAEL